MWTPKSKQCKHRLLLVHVDANVTTLHTAQKASREQTVTTLHTAKKPSREWARYLVVVVMMMVVVVVIVMIMLVVSN